MKQTIFLAIIITLLLTPVFAFFNQQEVSVYNQPDSPLRLSNVVSKWRISTDDKEQEWNMLTVEFVSQNVSNKTIRAYTIRQFEGEFNKGKGLTQFSYTTTPSGLLKPNQLCNEEIGEGGYRQIPQSIKLAVDFVEFTDGSTWGQDISESAQQLAGVRAGREAFLEHLKIINKQNGIEAVIKALDEIKDVLPPNDKSEIWKRGFRSGTSTIKFLMKSAYEKEGIKGAEIELQKSFDNSFSN
jgi:hypothetical protein